LIALASASIALSWPKTTFFRSRSRFFSLLRSSDDTERRRDARDLGDDLLDLVLADDLLLLRLGQDALRGAGLVDDVDRLVGQVAVVDVAADSSAAADSADGRVLDAVVLLEARLEALEDLDRLGDEGSLTSIFWKRRDSAWSFSKMPRYSL
jgi:hypothetical protein